MLEEEIYVHHLEGVIDFLKTTRAAAIRGYEQAKEELSAQAGYQGLNWSEQITFLNRRIEQMRSESFP